MSSGADAWSSPEGVNHKLDLWWAGLRPDRRQRAVVDVGRTLPEWLAQDLIRAGLPVEINPGLEDPTLAGRFLTPPLVSAFLASKQVQPERKWWRRKRK